MTWRPVSGSSTWLKLTVTHSRCPSRWVTGIVKLPCGSLEQFGERVRDLPVGLGVGVGGRPPRENGFVGQPVRAVPEDVGEGGIDLDDRALLVADEECLLQRVDQRGAPAGMVVAQPREFDVGAHAREQFGSGERFDEVVVGAGLQTFDGGFLAGAGRQQQHRHGGGAGIGAQRRHQGESVQPGHHHVADHEVGNDQRGSPSERLRRR